MATDSTGTEGSKGPDVLVSTVTALTASGAWVTWSGYRAASKTSGRPDYYISTLPLNHASTASSYNLVQIGAQAKTATVQLTVIALAAGGTAQLTAPDGTVTPLAEGVPASIPGTTTAGGAYTISFTGASCTLQAVHETSSGGTMEIMGGGDDNDPPPPYPI